jgi:hypothetical protein
MYIRVKKIVTVPKEFSNDLTSLQPPNDAFPAASNVQNPFLITRKIRKVDLLGREWINFRHVDFLMMVGHYNLVLSASG